MSSAYRWLSVPLLAGLVFAPVLSAKKKSSAGPPPPYFIDESTLPFAAVPGASASWGVHQGATFRIEVPAMWNGGLVLYAHGLRGDCVEPGDPACELRPSSPSLFLRTMLTTRGFAWAASSYSTAGRDIAQAAKDTKSLGQLFGSMFGTPTRTYVIGFSLGGGVTTLMIEQWPKLYDGAMPMCGVTDYPTILDTVALDYLMVAATAAGQEHRISFPMPSGVDYLTDIVPDIRAALGLVGFPQPLTPAGEQFKTAMEIMSGGPRAVDASPSLFDGAFVWWTFGNSLFSRFRDVRDYALAPGNISGNAETIYQLDSHPDVSPDEVLFNNRVPRDPYDPSSRHANGLSTLPGASGDLRVPMLRIFDLGDLLVPFAQERLYAELVGAAGRRHLLVQRAIRDYRHCGFTGPELETAFDDLVEWVEADIRPAGDDVLDDTVGADSQFGCQFTRDEGSHGIGALPIPPCP